MLSWKIPEFCSVGGARSKNNIFAFSGTIRLSCAQPTGNSFTQKQWYRWKAETLKVCFLLVWRVCDQAFGRYRHLNGAEKWSRDHHENWKFAYIYTHVEKFTDSKNAIIFDLWRKRTKLSRKKPFQNSGVTRRLGTLGRLELTLVVNTFFYFYYYYYANQHQAAGVKTKLSGAATASHSVFIVEGDRIPPLQGYGQVLKQENCFPGILGDDCQSVVLAQWPCHSICGDGVEDVCTCQLRVLGDLWLWWVPPLLLCPRP